MTVPSCSPSVVCSGWAGGQKESPSPRTGAPPGRRSTSWPEGGVDGDVALTIGPRSLYDRRAAVLREGQLMSGRTKRSKKRVLLTALTAALLTAMGVLATTPTTSLADSGKAAPTLSFFS